MYSFVTGSKHLVKKRQGDPSRCLLEDTCRVPCLCLVLSYVAQLSAQVLFNHFEDVL